MLEQIPAQPQTLTTVGKNWLNTGTHWQVWGLPHRPYLWDKTDSDGSRSWEGDREVASEKVASLSRFSLLFSPEVGEEARKESEYFTKETGLKGAVG